MQRDPARPQVARAGVEAFLAPGRGGRRGDRELPTRASPTASASATPPCASRNEGIVYCSTSGYGQDGPGGDAGPATTINYLAMGGFLALLRAAGPTAARTIPGATVADSAGGGMHAVLAILAALVRRRASSGVGASTSTCPPPRACCQLMALSTSTSTWPPAAEAAPAVETLLTGRYAFYDLYARRGTASGSPSAPSSPHFYTNLCKALGLRAVRSSTSTTTTARTRSAAAFAAASSRPGTGTTGWPSWGPANTCVAPVYSIRRAGGRPPLRRAPGRLMPRPTHPERRAVPPGRASAGRWAPRAAAFLRSAPIPTAPTPTSCWPAIGYDAARRSRSSCGATARSRE